MLTHAFGLQRNRAPICSFFVKGECKRGAECPYRHEMPTTGDLAHQNIKDRYYGVNDPVARKMMARADDMPKLQPPEDQSICTLCALAAPLLAKDPVLIRGLHGSWPQCSEGQEAEAASSAACLAKHAAAPLGVASWPFRLASAACTAPQAGG